MIAQQPQTELGMSYVRNCSERNGEAAIPNDCPRTMSGHQSTADTGESALQRQQRPSYVH